MTVQPLRREAAIGLGVALGAEAFEQDTGHALGALVAEMSTEDLLGLREKLIETFGSDIADVEADRLNPTGSMADWTVELIEHEIGARWVGGLKDPLGPDEPSSTRTEPPGPTPGDFLSPSFLSRPWGLLLSESRVDRGGLI